MPTLRLDQDREIYYKLIDGAPSAPWIVFLHEGLGSVAMWRDFPQRLCGELGCRGLVYDRQGHGRSSPFSRPRTIDYLSEYALDELPRIVSALLPGEPHALVGHSDGGSIALIYAAGQPAHLTSLVAEAPHVFVEEATLAGIRAATEAFNAGRLRGLALYHGDKTEAMFRAWSDTWLDAGFHDLNMERLLPRIRCPVLVVQGVDDQYGTVAQVDAIVAQAPRAEEAMLEGCGHAPHQEQPALVLALVAEFLRRNSTSA